MVRQGTRSPCPSFCDSKTLALVALSETSSSMEIRMMRRENSPCFLILRVLEIRAISSLLTDFQHADRCIACELTRVLGKYRLFLNVVGGTTVPSVSLLSSRTRTSGGKGNLPSRPISAQSFMTKGSGATGQRPIAGRKDFRHSTNFVENKCFH